MEPSHRSPCAVPGCDHPDGACWRYRGQLCAVHGEFVAQYHKDLYSDDGLLDELDRVALIDGVHRNRERFRSP
jgi:hypothetical protein